MERIVATALGDEEDDDMAGEARAILDIVKRIDRRGPEWHLQDQGERPRSTGRRFGAIQVEQQLAAILDALQGVPAAEIIARIDRRAAELAAGQAAIREQLRTELLDALAGELSERLADALREELGDVADERLVQAADVGVRRALGSLAAAGS